MKNKTALIRELNDQLRTTLQGGQIVITRGISSLPEADRIAVLDAVMNFSNWSEDVDEHQEHDLVSVEVNGHKVFAKIDYYDLDLRFLSPDASDPEVTKRVLTIMLAREY